MSRVLLISNSTLYGRGYLDHAEAEIRQFLGTARRVLFIPFALADRDAYAAKAAARFAAFGYDLTSIHRVADPWQALENTDALFVGGGNTFRLLKALYDHEIFALIRRRVAMGMPYIGSSAGSNVAGPTIKTTKDMPIVEPPSFTALGLVPFQISPHYLDPDPRSTHMGETQEERIRQFHEENATSVAGLREGAMLACGDGRFWLRGVAGARLFRKGREPVESVPVADVTELLTAEAAS
jgi:dipeptidase E